MVRDIDYMREILLQLEDIYPKEGDKYCYSGQWHSLSNISKYEEICAIAKKYEASCLLYDCGLIRSFVDRTNDYGIGFSISGISNKGYDFLDKVRENSKWEDIKLVIKEKGLRRYLEEM